jgi:pimeloyl-ACP methyl ester carboxylesterase
MRTARKPDGMGRPAGPAAFLLEAADGCRVPCLHYAGGGERAVVVAHGICCSKDAVLMRRFPAFLGDRCDVVMFDFRGHGESRCRYTWFEREHLDLERVLDFATGRYGRVGLIGISLGAAVGIEVLAKRRDVRSFVAMSAPYDPRRIDFRFWKLDVRGDIVSNLGEGRIGRGLRAAPFRLPRKRAIDAVGDVACPVLYIHGKKDWVTGYNHSEKLLRKTRSPARLVLVEEGAHAEHLLRRETRVEVESLVREWFADTL